MDRLPRGREQAAGQVYCVGIEAETRPRGRSIILTPVGYRLRSGRGV